MDCSAPDRMTVQMPISPNGIDLPLAVLYHLTELSKITGGFSGKSSVVPHFSRLLPRRAQDWPIKLLLKRQDSTSTWGWKWCFTAFTAAIAVYFCTSTWIEVQLTFPRRRMGGFTLQLHGTEHGGNVRARCGGRAGGLRRCPPPCKSGSHQALPGFLACRGALPARAQG